MTEKINHPNLRQLVAFCIYMQNNEGILGKTPSYLKEKFFMSRGSSVPEGMFDQGNLAKMREYASRWKLDWNGPRDYQYVPSGQFNENGEPTKEGLRIAQEKQFHGKTYLLIDEGKAITCKGCGSKSHDQGDVENLYCGACNKHHEK